MNLSEEIITQYVSLDKPSSKGWRAVACKVCNDHTRKGKRAGFIFTGSGFGYNCYNCGHSAQFDPGRDRSLSKDAVTTMRSFGIPDEDWKKLSFNALTNTYEEFTREFNSIEPATLTLPTFFKPVTDSASDGWSKLCIEYLKSRSVDWKSQPFFYVDTKLTAAEKKWYGRLIIPIYNNGVMVFYQGRDLTNTALKKYMSVDSPRENVLYGYDNIELSTPAPLYITEGWFDAQALQGVAILGNKLTDAQIKWINRSHRPKVVIPDRFGSGHLLAKQAIKLDWSISTLDVNDKSKDVNESICQHGLIYTLKRISANIVSGAQATIITNLYCKGE